MCVSGVVVGSLGVCWCVSGVASWECKGMLVNEVER